MSNPVARALFAILAFFLTLIFEILLAMTLFVWLRLNAPGLFNQLQGVAAGVLDFVRSTLQSVAPTVSQSANNALIGDLSANAMLLLILGLFASGVIRLLALMMRGAARRVAGARPDRPQRSTPRRRRQSDR